MRNKRLFSHGKTYGLWLATSLSLFGSCTVGDLGGSWTPDTQNAVLESPTELMITKSADESEMTIEWPVVSGAGGYEVVVYIADDPENLVPVMKEVDGEEKEKVVIDGCSVVYPLKSDTNYKILVRTLGNDKFNNKEAETPLEHDFSTLVPTYTTIPDGSDLTTFFNGLAKPEDSTVEAAYVLEKNGNYTMSGPINFEGQLATFRGDKTGYPTVVMSGDAQFQTQAGLKIKYINFQCANMESNAFLSLDASPNDALKIASGEFLIANPIVIQSCQVYDLSKMLVHDAKKKYCLDNLTITDSYMRFKQGNVVIKMESGTIMNFTVKNSTLYSTVQNGNFFWQIAGNRPDKVTGYVNGAFSLLNSTFYNLAYSKDWGNWNQIKGRASMTIDFEKSIFVNCGKGDINNKLSNGNNTFMYDSNTYWYNGARSNEKFDTNTLSTDPDFVNPLNGDFTVRGADQLAKRTGDPRWLPEESKEGTEE